MTKPLTGGPCVNTDRELWRETPDYYADSIHVTESGAIGINCGGYVYTLPVREWHRLAAAFEAGRAAVPREPTPRMTLATIDLVLPRDIAEAHEMIWRAMHDAATGQIAPAAWTQAGDGCGASLSVVPVAPSSAAPDVAGLIAKLRSIEARRISGSQLRDIWDVADALERLTRENADARIIIDGHDAVLDDLQAEVDRLTRERDELEAQRDTLTHVDERGTAWTAPTGWAYMMSCRRAEKAERERDEAGDAFQKIVQWADAYPLDVFPVPDWKLAAEGLRSVGITLDAVSAANMRHVVEGVGKIARAWLAANEPAKGEG